MLLDGDRIVRAAFYGRIVGDDDALPSADPSDAGEDPAAGYAAPVHAVRRELGELEERTAGVEQHPDPLPRGELARGPVPADRGLRTALGRASDLGLEAGGHLAHGRLVVAELLRAGIEPGGDAGHGLVTMA
jgi:hypothetical protein